MSLETTKLACKLTKRIKNSAKTFYPKDDDASINGFTVGYMESLIARLMETSPEAKQYVLEFLKTAP